MGQVIYPRWRPFLVPGQALYPRWSLSQFHLSQLVPQSGFIRPWKICASWISVWNISANHVLVPLKFNMNWNIWKPFLKSSPLDFSGQRLGNTSLVVFFRFHSFIFTGSRMARICKGIYYKYFEVFNVKLAQLTEVRSFFNWSWVSGRTLYVTTYVLHICMHFIKQTQ